jgi:UDP-N-acetylmuramoylalanine--D-glutamate ligase
MPQKLAIIGFGMEGEILLDFFVKESKENEIWIFDEKLSQEDFEKNDLVKLNSNRVFLKKDLIIPKDFKQIYKSPGVPDFRIQKENPKTQTLELINILFDKIKGKIVGITGTKGKSTISSLIYHILKQNGFEVELLGNIGEFKTLEKYDFENPNKIFVYEMSSYMCESLKKRSPEIAVFSNFYPDHLDYHQSIDNYWKAKLKITEFQTQKDLLITIPELVSKIQTKAKIVSTNSNFNHIPTKLFGKHNQINCQLAFLVAQNLGVNSNKILEAIVHYQPLKGRLEKIAKVGKIIFYEDALATIPEATWAAIKAFEQDLVIKDPELNLSTLILGGLDRGIDFEKFAKQLKTTKIQNFIIFPTTGKKMVKYINDRNIFCVFDMQEAVKIAYKVTKGVCLLSTASPSYNLFKNYQDRSQKYRKFIEILSKTQKIV